MGTRRELFRLRSWLVLFLLAYLPAGAVPAPARMALVIGNAAYASAPLANPVNDARAVTSSLREVGFTVTLVEDADVERMRASIRRFAADLPPEALALVYFAGHGLQHRGVNYLLPVDFGLRDAASLSGTGVRVDGVMAALHEREVEMVVLVLDACRDNPFGRPEEALGPGLAPVESSPGETLVAYATAAGSVAADGDWGNSPFTAALVTALEEPGLDLYDVFRRVRAAVREATEGRQLPWVSGSIESAVVLRPEAGPPEAALGSFLAEKAASLASVYWRTIERSTDPADFDRFLQLASTGPLADAARDRRERLVVQGLPSTPVPEVKRAGRGGPPGGLLASQTECDLVASSPIDQARVAESVPYGLVNTRLALRACTQAVAADPENPRLAYILGRVLGIAGRHDEAAPFYERAASKDYAAALTDLALLHRNGVGVARDLTKAVELYRRAAAAGNPSARNSIGDMYRNALGVPRDLDEAAAWTRLAADAGWVHAYHSLGDMYRKGEGVPQDGAKAFALYEKAASLGSSDAMNRIGRVLRFGEGVPRNTRAAVSWFQRAIEAGNVFAPRELGRMYLDGDGVGRDPRRALALFQLAAERGYVESFADIGSMYEKGDGVTADPGEALFYYRLSVESGRLRDGTYAHAPSLEGVERVREGVGAEDRAKVEARVAEFTRKSGPVPPRRYNIN